MDDLDAWLRSLPDEWTAGCDRDLFESAHGAYDLPERHYHTWRHVLECVEKLRTFPCDRPPNVFLALVFHDAIYLAGHEDNEARSADLSTTELERHSNLGASDIAEIRRMILATRDHRVDPGEASRDLRAVVDIDMSILGATEERYREYAEDVRREYCPGVTTARRYRIGRSMFLKGLFEGGAIYSTGEGAARWEASARRNVAWEIGQLGAEMGVFERVIGWMATVTPRA